MAKIESLDSLWDFKFSETELAPEEIVFDSKQPVPGCFDAGGEHRYRRGIGYYRRTVRCGGLVRLTIGALGLRAGIFWDAKPVRRTQRAYSREVLIFDSGAAGEHQLLIAVDNRYDETPSSLFRRDYDFYGYGGIYRSVTLEELPEDFIESVQVIPEDIAGGTVRVKINSAAERCKVAFDGGNWVDCAPVMRVPDFKLWSPDSPHLHRITVDNGSDRTEVVFGLRRVEARDGCFCLNGKPLKIFGVNRHDAYPGFGAAVPLEKLEQDLRMIKKAGFNTIRGSHYPQSEEMLTLCDRLGLLVWEESLGWGDQAEALTDPVFMAEQCEQTRQMVQKSINHPSVVIWGFLNEAETKDLRARQIVSELVRTIRAGDTSRLISYATMFRGKDVCMDLVDIAAYNTYPGWGGAANLFFDPAAVARDFEELMGITPPEKPFLISEIGAGALIGTHHRRRWSEEYQAELLGCVFEYVRKNPRCSGVIVWQFCDTETDNNIRVLERPRGFNNKGIVDEYRRPKLAWLQLEAMLKASE